MEISQMIFPILLSPMDVALRAILKTIFNDTVLALAHFSECMKYSTPLTPHLFKK